MEKEENTITTTIRYDKSDCWVAKIKAEEHRRDYWKLKLEMLKREDIKDRNKRRI